MPFKQQIVREIEHGQLTITEFIEKYSILKDILYYVGKQPHN